MLKTLALTPERRICVRDENGTPRAMAIIVARSHRSSGRISVVRLITYLLKLFTLHFLPDDLNKCVAN